MSATTAPPTSTTSTTSPSGTTGTSSQVATVPARRTRPAPPPIPFSRLLGVELRKMFDTRAGAWLMASIAITALVASVSVVAWAPDSALTYDSFAAAIGLPMAVILPIVSILSVTAEWTQRTGLTTFTLVPHRGRSIAAKALASLLIAVVSVAVAGVVGALGNVAGAALNGIDPVWDLPASALASILLANVLGVGIGFMLGVLLRSSPVAMVAYLVSVYVLTGVTFALAAAQSWFADLQPWVDFNFTQGNLFAGPPVGGEGWAQLGVTTLIWLVLPLGLGLWRLMRSEVT